MRPSRRSTLFPYTTLFRSKVPRDMQMPWRRTWRSQSIRLRSTDALSCHGTPRKIVQRGSLRGKPFRSEEHTSELQSRQYLVCRLLLEKKKLGPTARTCHRG